MNDFAVKDIQWIAEGNGLPLLHDQYFISITTRQVQVMQDAHHAIPPVGNFPGQRQGLLLMQQVKTYGGFVQEQAPPSSIGTRSEERRVGKECDSTFRTRRSPSP